MVLWGGTLSPLDAPAEGIPPPLNPLTFARERVAAAGGGVLAEMNSSKTNLPPLNQYFQI